MKQNKSKGIKQREAEGGRGGRWLREGGKERERWMNPIIPLFSFTALNLIQSGEQKKRR